MARKVRKQKGNSKKPAANTGSATTTTVAPESRRGSGGPFDVIKGTIADQLILPFVFANGVIPGFDLLWWKLSEKWFGASGHALVGMFFFFVGGFLTIYTYLESESRSRWVKWRFAATTAWFFFTIPTTMIFGWPGWWIGILQLIGCAFALWWVIASFESVTGSGRDTHRDDGLAEALGMPGARPGKITGDEISRTINVTHPDQTHKEMGDVVPKLIAKGGFPVSGVRYVPGKRGGFGKFVIIYKDILSGSMTYEGPSIPGGSIAQPMRIGRKMSATSPYLTMCVVGPSGAIHSLRVGMPGSGKTSGFINELMEACTRVDVVYWLSDTLKGDSLYPWVGPAIDWFEESLAGTKAQIAALERIIPARMKYLTSVGLREWKPGCGLPFMRFIMEEAARVANDLGEKYIRLLEGARSAGISIDTSMQRASGGNLDTDARANFGMGWGFGMRQPEDPPMVLSEETLDSGADPTLWQNREPGKCYLENPFENSEEWGIAGRTYDIPDDFVMAHIIEWAPKMCPLDSISANAAGEQYARRVRHPSSGPSTMLPFNPKRLTRKDTAVDDFSWISAPLSNDTTPDDNPPDDTMPPWGAPTDPDDKPPARPNDNARAGDDTEWNVPTEEDDNVNNYPEDDNDLFEDDNDREEFNEEKDDLRKEAEMIGRHHDDSDDDEIDQDEIEAERVARQETEDDAPMRDVSDDELLEVELGDAFTPGAPLSKLELDMLFIEICMRLIGEREIVTVRKRDLVDKWFDTPGTAAPPSVNMNALDRRLRQAERQGACERARHGYWTLTRGVRNMTFTSGDVESDDE